MATSYTSLLGLALPVTGELAGTWGDTVNNAITSLLDSAVAGTTTLSTDADVTLSTTTGATNQARQAILLCSGARTALRTITAPAQSKIYVVINSATGGYGVKLVGAGPTTGVTVAAGKTAVLVWNGSDFIEVAPATATTATNLAGGAAGSVPYQSAASTTTFLSLGTTAQVLQVNAGATAPEWVSSTGTGNVVRATSPTLVTPVLGTPSSGNFSTGTFTWPTFNQSTTGSAAKWTTARTLAGNSVDGSANVAFANKFIVQGTTDAGLSGAQFLGALSTGLLKNTTTTGVLSVAVAATDYVAPSAYASANGLTMATSRLLGRTTALSGAAEEISVAGGLTLSGGVLTGTSGTVTAISVSSANGFAGTSSGGATPALTLSTTVTGVLKGNGTAISAATAGTDYSAGTSALATGILKSTTTTGALSIAVAADFPTLNQNTTGTAAGLSATLVATSGGTGQSSYAIGDLLYASTTTALSKLADVATGNALISGGVGVAPSWGKIGLTTHVSGTLPVANGGTGTTTAFTLGSVLFAGASGVYSQDNAQFFWDGTNNRLGIGTATPGSLLDVNGNTNITGTLTATSNFSATNSWALIRGNSVAWPTTVVGQSAGRACLAQSGGNALLLVHDDTAVAANTGPSGITFSGRSNDTGPAYVPFGLITALKENATQGNGNSYMVLKTSLSGSGLLERMRIDSAGNVGIGTASPAQPLNVNGNARVDGILMTNGGTAAAPTHSFTSDLNTGIFGTGGDVVGFSTGGTERMRIDSAGNVGVGTSSPGYRLDVVTGSAITAARFSNSGPTGGATITSTNTAQAIWAAGFEYNGTAFVARATTASSVYADSGYLSFTTNTGLTSGNTFTPAERARIDSSGNLLVGSTSTYVLNLHAFTTNSATAGVMSLRNGGATAGTYHYIGPDASQNFVIYNQASTGVYLASGGTAWTGTSDERVKDIIEPIENAAEKVSSLRAVIGKYKKDADGTRRSFLIAQDVQAVLPEAIDVQNDELGTLGLRYTDTIPLLVAAIQELKAEIDALKKQSQQN